MKRTVTSVLLSLFFLCAAAAYSQPVPTGTVDVTLGDESRTFTTYAQSVAADVAADIEDEAAADFASRFAGTDVHSATYMAIDAIAVAGNVIVPAQLTVIIDARANPDPLAEEGVFEVTFSLDPATLTLVPDMGIDLRYAPPGTGVGEGYVLLEDTGTITLDEVEATGENALSVAGSFSGTLGYQSDPIEGPDPSDSMPVEGTFAIEAVVGSTAIADLLTGE